MEGVMKEYTTILERAEEVCKLMVFAIVIAALAASMYNYLVQFIP